MKVDTIFRAQAKRFPDKDAVVCGPRRLSYQELDRRSDQLAGALQGRGLREGDRVLLTLGNSAAFAEAFLGAIKAGAIVVPVNTYLTQQETAFIVQDCAPSAIVFDPPRRPVIRAVAKTTAVPLLIMSGESETGEADIRDLIATGGDAPPPIRTTRSDDCMICYTAGTTGRPKGAVITHANLVIAKLVNATEWRTGCDDRYLMTTPLAHRAGLSRLVDALLLGATSVIMPSFNAAEAVATVEREQITVMSMVPTIARLLIPEIARDPRHCRSVRVILVTGEAFPLELKRRLVNLMPSAQLISFFAMTEAGIVTRLSSEEQLSHGSSIGRPTPGIEFRLVDDAGAEVATGETGELLVRSGEPGRYLLMRGYYPAETSASLSDGWFATGDLARADADGYLYIVDRKKDMIKRGGYNIYSKEVELALHAHPAVQDAAVIGAADDVFGECVVAFVELKADAAASEPELIEHCRTLVASYKRPKRVFFRALPRNAAGKVLKFALRDELRAAAQKPD